jgi:putative transposase-like DNA-binding protein
LPENWEIFCLAASNAVERSASRRRGVQEDRAVGADNGTHVCGHLQDMALNMRTFVCRQYWTVEDRDINPAINILEAGRRFWPGDTSKTIARWQVSLVTAESHALQPWECVNKSGSPVFAAITSDDFERSTRARLSQTNCAWCVSTSIDAITGLRHRKNVSIA